MRRARSLRAAAAAAACLAILVPGRARAGHGVAIQKVCVGPDGDARVRAADPMTCRITVTNADTLGDALRVDQIFDVVDAAAGLTTTPNLVQADLGLPCVMLAPGASVTVSHEFTVGDPENDPLQSAGVAVGADLRNGGAAVPAGCPTGGLSFTVAFSAEVDVVQCLDAGDCDLGSACSTDSCDASGACVHAPRPDTTVCRSARGVCDLAEQCTGADLACPADLRSTDVCRSAAGVCDEPERCDGATDDCPPDAFLSSSVVCRSATGACDVAERCPGTGPDCPTDARAASGTVCRSAAGVCDVAEKCDGASVDCPRDAKKTGTCRPSIDVCDVPEGCDGIHDDCPADGFASSTITCRAPYGPCDAREYCSGVGPHCPPDAVKPAGTLCRAAAGTCDLDDACDGASVGCPDVLKPSGASCDGDGNVCTGDVCNGTSPACTHPPGNAGTVCRPAAGQCDQAETCTGSGLACPPDQLKPAGTPCDADGDRCTVDQCDGSGACVVVGDATDPSCPVCGETATGPCVVTVDGVAGTFSTLQAAVKAAPNGGTVHVSGVCRGQTVVKSRSGITIEGTPPSTCPPGPRDLTATLMGDPTQPLPSGSNGEVLKILSSTNIVVRWLNIVDGDANGAGHDGFEMKTATNTTGYCNCVARNVNGIELDAPGGHVVMENHVMRNSGWGIRVHGAQTASFVLDNLVEQNKSDGIVVSEQSHQNEISTNVCRANGGSGILLDNGDANTFLANDVHDNTVAGIRLKNGSDGNTIGSSAQPNLIHADGDGLTNLVLCVGDLTANTGTNVPATAACQ